MAMKLSIDPLAAALAWLLKTMISHFLLKDIEVYKTRLSSETTKEIEHFKAHLQILAIEHDVRFTKLHERRARIIAKLYSLLDDANHNTYIFMQSDSLRSEGLIKKALETYNACVEMYLFFHKHRLYFSKELVNKMELLMNDIIEPSEAYVASVGTQEYGERYATAVKSWTEKRDQIDEAFELMEKEFRKLLGSET
jgi:hypothetical protein